MKHSIIFLALAIVALSSCKKDSTPNYEPPALGTSVTITGANTAHIVVPSPSDSVVVHVNGIKVATLHATGDVTFTGGTGTIISDIVWPSLGTAFAVVK